MKTERTFIVPGNAGTIFTMFVGSYLLIIPAFIAFMFVLVLVSGENISPFWLILSIIFSAGCLLFAYLMQKYLRLDAHKVIINFSNNTITSKIKNRPEVCYSIGDVSGFISVREYIADDCRCSLNLSLKGRESVGFLKEYSIPYAWDLFTNKLSKFTKIPLTCETWIIDYDGNSKQVSADELSSNRKKGIFGLIIPVFISFLGAKLFKFYPSLHSLLWIGCVTVILNLSFYLIFYLRKEEELKKFKENISTSILVVIRLIVTFGIYYMLAVFAINGLELFK